MACVVCAGAAGGVDIEAAGHRTDVSIGQRGDPGSIALAGEIAFLIAGGHAGNQTVRGDCPGVRGVKGGRSGILKGP